MPSARKLLVANRGEIAVRIFATCRRLGIGAVAVVEPGDERSLHARVADEVVPVASYLDADALVAAAKSTAVELVHPGYGFLAESSELAESVVEGGLTWVGPPPDVLRRGGDKLEAKRIAADAGVPTLPTGDPAELGFPLLVKAAAGGGGRGMRVVEREEDLSDALEAAAREAEAAFGDGRVYCERFLPRPRHVEVQLLGDRHGNVVSMGLRDCSVQRRHQKVIEESPPPGLSRELQGAIEAHAVAFARTLGYESAGTAEFLVAGGEAFFLELNGRIQVEHPVTEEATGNDLVELQLLAADGQSFADFAPTTVRHAIEARLYAEDPRSFLPQPGTIRHLDLPDTIVRVDAGVEAGDTVGTQYDPLIAKLIASGRDRDDALDRLSLALDETVVAGVTTNLPLLRWLVAHPAFRGGELSTSFLSDYPPLSPPPRPAPRPWSGGWRLNRPPARFAAAPQVETAARGGGAAVGDGRVTSPMPGKVIEVRVEQGAQVESHEPLVVLEAMKMEQIVSAPYDAAVRSVEVAVGDQVATGTVLVMLETA